ncbi:DNA (cytosine-5)-methyltransferase PliMCI [Lepeophtheirus salmonis]|uniref:DNA (cytosine-5)-methyltransferase PliMCI n=1 Tax=Lepeophtheirus salmonis TaxID=72036 RepID=UPI001AEADAAF|nr:DNA (cytosine-5)-methyltransferase PliMCI-like [Lepeophtheirus salmonis]
MGKTVTEVTIKKAVLNLKRLSQDDISDPKRIRIEEDARCTKCNQWIDRALRYSGHPEDSQKEETAIENSSIRVDLGDDHLPQFRITSFSFYDRENHLVSLDSGIIEKNEELYMSGYLKIITCDDPSEKEGIPVYDIGPIRQWWNGGFDGGSKNIIGVSSELAEFYLLNSSNEYIPLWNEVQEKSYLAKVVIEFLEHARDNGLDITYEDLANEICDAEPEHGGIVLTPDALVKHSTFVVNQVISYDNALREDEEDASLYTMMASNCIMDLISFSGVKKFKSQVNTKQLSNKPVTKKNAKIGSKATTTPLVKKMFETLFEEQIAMNSTPKKTSDNVKNAVCPVVDCPSCKRFKSKKKLDNSVNSSSDFLCSDEHVQISLSSPMTEYNPYGMQLYGCASIDEEIYMRSEYAMIRPTDPSIPLCVAFLVSFYKDEDDYPMAHIVWFSNAEDSIIGKTHQEKEIFLLNECEDIPISAIVRKANVIRYEPKGNWYKIGGTTESLLLPEICPNDEFSFFYRFMYNGKYCRFETCKNGVDVLCSNGQCKMCKITEEAEEPPSMIGSNKIKFEGVIYHVDDAVFLSPDAFNFKYSYNGEVERKMRRLNEGIGSEKDIDEDKYPEKYRKYKATKNSGPKIQNPFCIGIIKNITKSSNRDYKLKVRVMYRPENTYYIRFFSEITMSKSFNYLYWSEDEEIVDIHSVKGKCFIRPKTSIRVPIDEWSEEGEYRFYYSELYDSVKDDISELSFEALNYPRNKDSTDTTKLNKLPEVPRRLRTLDVFAGCGGLSKGLYEAGISDPCWAIENYKPAAEAFKVNHPDCIVFNEDCNKLLQNVMNGILINDKNQKMPKKGDVDLLVGGPPCQGFSGMNRFNSGEYSSFKNSLVVSYLSYCDYYRPKYFILENVRNFAIFKDSSVLKMCMSTLIRIGYQCTFGILQAGMYGVAQSRRRIIILAAAPGEKLPTYPLPKHVFPYNSLSVQVDDKTYLPSLKWDESAPYRTITVRDAIFDLPPIESGDQMETRSYESPALCHFQRKMRQNSTNLSDHNTKKVSPLIHARIALIPTFPGSDWRDLPNIKMKLSDGTETNILMYPSCDYIQGANSQGKNRGVCQCAKSSKADCDPMDKQAHTLIPWCLPHSGNRHGHWQGLYGRIDWDAYFQTIVTNPEPMGKQGRVLHPEQNRVVSVRECARSQGFADSFKFCGSMADKYKQIGNAVPPPLGLAIGIEIRRACFS